MAALALLWLGIAVVIAVVAARRFSLAQQVLDAAQANARLLEVMPARPLLLWFFDTSAGEEERAKLSLRLRQTEAALGSLTQLIESAPFPMWYRGPDLKLGLVNSAFVSAVESKDAAEVIA